MPVADELFDDLGGRDCFSTLDLRMGYHQIRIREGDQWKLAFWGHDDIYMPLRTPFGPKNAPALFQRLMDRVLRQLREVARAFIDDTIVHSCGFEAHLDAFRAVFEQLRKYNIKVHPKKIRILFQEIPFLRHLVNPGCSVIARPLNNLLKKDLEFPRSCPTECKAAIDQLKAGLCAAPLLVRPDPGREFELHTDWSAAGCGAILQQRYEAGNERVVAYASRSNNRAESNYSSYAGECLPAVWGLRYFRVYLYGVHFKLYTDHRPLEWLMTSQNLTGMHARWALMLQEFDFEVKYRKGLVNMNADGLSRSPLPETEDLTGARVHDDPPAEPMWAASALLAWQAWAVGPALGNDQQFPWAWEIGGEEYPDDPTELGGERAKSLTDIWEDVHRLQVMRGEQPDPAWSEKEQERVRRRSLSYRFEDGELLRRLGNGEEKVVPPPAEREGVVQAVHEETGHWGEKRTVHLLKRAGMYESARRGVAGCHHCDRTKAAFAKEMSVMQSLPIMGLGVAEAFLGVLTRFGACAEVLTDNGKEFEGEFDQLCQQVLLDHRTTSRYHPKSNGLTERLVRTIKAGITKFGSEADRRTWDEWLP
ncbi:hypothetical protein KFL_007470065 [Klebsormidium nitens]|uniref:Integrase catalytic domain-containing protein n=1 Tax=Klebsormidium nitens TaxID=105231 RepID=A0A1Y1IRG3_KLENI|nr:hypothetical protein KFL_007470065 [Klebsormidium nitens]|eukprot:GAQ91227.1 hypothetical protein KFL_007470065 [Klebsormidium nitens]